VGWGPRGMLELTTFAQVIVQNVDANNTTKVVVRGNKLHRHVAFR
jgi:hypothetical protein